MLAPRDHLRHLAPYELPARAATPARERLELDQNENYAPASPKALAAARAACAECVRYPNPDALELRAAIAELHGLRPDRVVCGRGAMELIQLIVTAYLEPGSSAVSSEFGYLYFRTATELAGARMILAPEPALIADPVAMAAAVDETTRLLFIANPGNPTGSFVSKSALLALRRALPESVILVIDEAYAEFVEPDRYQSCFDMVDEGATVVLRTFSKIYGMAGLRVGWGYFPAAIAAVLRIVQQPNGVTGPSQAAAIAALGDQDHLEGLRTQTASIRESFARSLQAMGLNPLPSSGNFVLLRFDCAPAAADADARLRADAIAVRGMHGYGLPDCLRITLGTERQMERVTGALRNWTESR